MPTGLDESLDAPTPLQPEVGCCGLLNWRFDVPVQDDQAAGRLVDSLATVGFESRCRHPALRVLRHPDGHEIAWVLATGRVQVRVDIATPRENRQDTAERLRRTFLASFAAPQQVEHFLMSSARQPAGADRARD